MQARLSGIIIGSEFTDVGLCWRMS